MRSRSLALALVLHLAAVTVAGAQRVLLRIQPHDGDTISMRLDQSSQLTGTRLVGSRESSNSVVSGMRVFSRAIVESSTERGAIVLAVTDSAFLSTTDTQRGSPGGAMPAQLGGMRVRVRVLPDGVVEMAEGDPRGNTADMLAMMPASLPREAVAVGASWTREMALPSSNPLGAPAGRLHARFRLDSLSRNGELAYVSLRGDIEPADSADVAVGAPRVKNGTVKGMLLLDRKRGWLTETHFDITVHSTLTPAPSTGAAPMRFLMRVTQRMRTLDNR